jgi:hypothetical protein
MRNIYRAMRDADANYATRATLFLRPLQHLDSYRACIGFSTAAGIQVAKVNGEPMEAVEATPEEAFAALDVVASRALSTTR